MPDQESDRLKLYYPIILGPGVSSIYLPPKDNEAEIIHVCNGLKLLYPKHKIQYAFGGKRYDC